MTEPRVVAPPTTVYRLGRLDDPLRFSQIRPEDALSQGGNRFDVPGAGVLYAASTRAACFGETLSRFRPSPTLPRRLLDNDGPFMNVGTVPRDWRLKRRMVEIMFEHPARFLDADAVETHAHLTDEMGVMLQAMGHSQPLDTATVRGPDRRLTRAIATYAYQATDEHGNFLYDGIAYRSRISTDWDCWAVFDSTPVDAIGQETIEANDPDLVTVAEMWDLNPF